MESIIIHRVHIINAISIFYMLKPRQYMKHLPKRFNPYRNDIFKDKYKKQPWNGPSSTIMAHLKKDGLMFIHPDSRQNRTLTPRARLQSFDDAYTFEGFRRRIQESAPASYLHQSVRDHFVVLFFVSRHVRYIPTKART
jgi:site-specific DNA-cytosine methylase